MPVSELLPPHKASSPVAPTPSGTSHRIDRWLTHRVWGTLIFGLTLLVVFQSVFLGAKPITDGIDFLFATLASWCEHALPDGALRSLLVHGILTGVGSLLRFLPQITILFFFIAILEESGYLARAAVLMDRWMSRIGLSGHSFVPMLSCFACTVPGILGARSIRNERDRFPTILAAPLLPCSARLPLYAMLIAAFIPPRSWLGGLVSLQGLTLCGLYALGILAAIAVAAALRRTLFCGEGLPVLVELPPYRRPSLREVSHRVASRAGSFIASARTLILAVSVLVWAALYYPHNAPTVEPLRLQREAVAARLAELPRESEKRAALSAEEKRLDRRMDAEYQQQSYLGQFGRWMEPVVRPLGWDWRIGCSVLASLSSREVVVASLGVMYNLGGDPSDPRGYGSKLREATWPEDGKPIFTTATAMSLMVFFALCGQCMATLGAIRAETRSWFWPAFAFTYMTALAYLGALAVHQLAG